IVKTCFVASVNGQLISRLSVIKDLEKQGGQKTLDVIILKALVTQEAKKKKIVISQKDVDTEIKKIEANIVSQGLTLDQLLEQQGMTKNSLNEEIKVQLSLNKLVGSDIKVSDKEIDDYLSLQNDQSSLSPTESLTREQVSEQLKQQKLQEKIQTYLTDLKAKAKINYFVKY
ncbi:MAG: SurA N-terminal domain-containing protein, partial [Candidatus Roizmanbacteria bacterium]